MIEEPEVFYTPKLPLPNGTNFITSGDIIILERFSTVKWLVGFGWFSFDGNRRMNGWYLKNIDDDTIKPLLDIDLYDIYFVDNSHPGTNNPTVIPPIIELPPQEEPIEPEPTPEEPEHIPDEPDNDAPILYSTYNEERNLVNFYYRRDLPRIGTEFDGYKVDALEVYDNDSYLPLDTPPCEPNVVKNICLNDDFVSTLNGDIYYEMLDFTALVGIEISPCRWYGSLDMSGMFEGCINLSTAALGDMDNLVITNAESAFKNCYNLLGISANFGTETIHSVSYMFENCHKLRYDASHYNPSIPLHEDFNKEAPGVIAPEWDSEYEVKHLTDPSEIRDFLK